ncbi:MAG: zinc-dependent peptidase [Chitinophagaceae bacterium]|nr:zinc-dependent peptidase [Chitinophagaceae bacterium]MCW5929474.1 zinc-dependent peptidase [Chitinophagaceae bacterium]
MIIYWLTGAVLGVIIIIWYLRRFQYHSVPGESQDHAGHDKLAAPEEKHIACPLVYNGSELHFSDKVLDHVLTKHFSFYNHLLDIDKERFLTRLRKFIATKVFVIHDGKGYREMPILISASAVQLTFGLKKYLLSHFHIIQIFPEAFVGLEPFRILIGNVTGNTINIAWKQFLEGYKNKYELQNVGLHEMAHALYYQNFETSLYVDKEFRDSFQKFNSIGDKIYHVEKILTIGLYSEYAIKDFQEFWAESIEIYFKSPDRLQLHYPELYNALCDILNQDPLNYPHHLFSQD